jgi:hypothetical protein
LSRPAQWGRGLSGLLELVFGRAEDLAQELEGVGFELNELESDVETSRGVARQPLDPHHLRRVRNRRNVCKKEFHFQELADAELVVAVDADASETDVDRFPLASDELHPRRAAVERGTDPAILSAILLG